MGACYVLHGNVQRELMDIDADLPPAQYTAITILLSIALWSAIEMVPLVFFTFKRFRTLYFWSIFTATLGVLLCSTSQIISTWGPRPFSRTRIISSTISCIGWAPMVTGQSFVLFSRLHLLNVQQRTLRLVRAMLIFNGVVLHTMGTAFTLEPLISNSQHLSATYAIFEKVQITVFMAQEFLLSSIYLNKAYEFMGQYSFPLRIRSSSTHGSRERVHRLLLCLIAANVTVMLLDVTIIALEFAGFHEVQLSYKVFAYAVKLKIELGILNQLVDFVHRVHRLQTEADISAGMEREWNSTLERTFSSPIRLARSPGNGHEHDRQGPATHDGEDPSSGQRQAIGGT